jgi:hypothetical protein
MPRQSAQEQAAIEAALDAPRLAPPDYLTPEQRLDWELITAKFPGGYFGGDNAPLLEQLVTHTSLARQLAEQLNAMRRLRLNAATPHGAKVRAAYRQLHRMQSTAIVQLSTKLRLAHSTRRNDRVDERRLDTLPSGPKPWEQ